MFVLKKEASEITCILSIDWEYHMFELVNVLSFNLNCCCWVWNRFVLITVLEHCPQARPQAPSPILSSQSAPALHTVPATQFAILSSPLWSSHNQALSHQQVPSTSSHVSLSLLSPRRCVHAQDRCGSLFSSSVVQGELEQPYSATIFDSIPICSGWCIHEEEQEDDCWCTRWCYSRLGSLWVVGVPPSHSLCQVVIMCLMYCFSGLICHHVHQQVS